MGRVQRPPLIPQYLPHPSIALRDYQQRAIADIDALTTQGHRRILVSGNPGSGKSATMSAIARRAYNNRWKTTILVPFNCIVSKSALEHTQMVGALDQMGLSGHYGVYSGAFPTLEKPDAPIQIVTLQTLQSREELHSWLSDSDLILIDEGHSATFFNEVERIYEGWSWKAILNFTATPFNRSQGIDERHGKLERNTAIVTMPPYRDLQKMGHLAPLSYHSLICHVGDNEKLDLDSDEAIHWMLGCWLGRVEDPRFAVGFCKPKYKGQSQMDRIQQIAASEFQFPFAIVGDGVSQQNYESAIAEYEAGQVGLLNVQQLSTGWDMPITQHILLFRQIPSRDRYVQVVGRASRPFPGKSCGNIWDFAGNVKLGESGLHPKIEDLSESIDASVLLPKIKGEGDVPMKFCCACKKKILAAAPLCKFCKTLQPQGSIAIVDPSTGQLVSSISDLVAQQSIEGAIAYFRQWRKIGYLNQWKPFSAMKKCLEVQVNVQLDDSRFWRGSIFEEPEDQDLRSRYHSYLQSRAKSWNWTSDKIKREVNREFSDG